MERGRNLKRPHFLSNANTALQFLQSKKVSIFKTSNQSYKIINNYCLFTDQISEYKFVGFS